MSDLSELYQELILDHNRRPKNFGVLEHPDRQAHGHNPLCGDRWTVALGLHDGLIADIAFTGAGCAISKASASLMTEAVRGRTVDDALRLVERFHGVLTGPVADAATDDEIGKLSVFRGVREFPMRVKCATLAWHTLKAALLQADTPVVRTE